MANLSKIKRQRMLDFFVSNMIFVFLYCIGKMTRLNFKADDRPKSTIFEKYPVVWWTNLILVGLLLISLWGWFIQKNIVTNSLLEAIRCHPFLFFIIGSLILLVFIAAGIIFLAHKTRVKESD